MPARDTTSAPRVTPEHANVGARASAPIWLTRRREALLAGGLLALAGALRLDLAAHGWPYLNSDEAVMGLMGVDIWQRGSRPAFTYSQNYIGALQAYLSAPFFALLNGDPLALRLATLVQTLLFLAVIYALARRLFSPGVALLTLGLLVAGPDYALKHQLQAGVGAQDTLLFGALVVWLAVLRLRGGWTRWQSIAIDAGLGLAVGLGLWGDFLFLPYVAVAAIALGYIALRAVVSAHHDGRAIARSLALELATTLGATIIGAAPLLVANIASGGATFSHVMSIAGTPGAGSPVDALGARLAHVIGEVGATLLAGIPNALGSDLVCRGCAVWPAIETAPPAGQAARAALISAPFTIVAIGLWLWSATPLAHDVRSAWARATARGRARWSDRLLTLPAPDARWWGRVMLVVGGGLTVLQYMVSEASFSHPTYSNRYLIGIYICAPLVAAPLALAVTRTWRAARARMWPEWRPALGTALLAVILGLNITGAARADAGAHDATTFGNPLSAPDAQMVEFLETHHATRFYTGYWTCERLILATRERLSCAVMAPHDAFEPGFDRYPPAVRAVASTPHPAWVFNLRSPDVEASVRQQIATCVRAGAPRCVGYNSATVGGYLVYYYAG